ncbi:transglycosylase domain-containing protein [Ramlibacter sp. AW1]|uniref:peptidoglycan glycosyltransferase n=1 Tax=Ramlibacter aurantiacus TaxID=2801330 RepID=A0A936ZPE6_9BURK|nr:transglycosylase domain-containing protein [Ramlibacter aurantiacus]MBL0421075.1 transglycosylase domain-containing protein [Ramlibacter aurantiacus]
MKRFRLGPLRVLQLLLVLVLLLAGAAVAWEIHTSTLQARYFSAWARELRFEVQPGPRTDTRYPRFGPYDERLGHTRLPEWLQRLDERGFRVTAQAKQSPDLVRHLDRGLFPPYREKAQAGLSIVDCRREPIFQSIFPQRAYPSFEAIPPLLVQVLAFIENREIVDATAPRHNPAVEWPRLGQAVLDQAVKANDPAHQGAGGSTLATQLEKFRHSEDGRTAHILDKGRQMVSASLRAYLDGELTAGARQRIVLDYINSLPLGAQRHYGEVIGVQDGLRLWFGADPAVVDAALRGNPADPAARDAQALGLRQVLALLIAQRRPSFYLGPAKDRLNSVVDAYLRVLADAGVVGPTLRDAALSAPLQVREAAPDVPTALHVGDRKAVNSLRVELASLLDTPRLYDLDRLDLHVTGTFDHPLQKAVTETLRQLRDPAHARAAGLLGPGLIEGGDAAEILYTFTLYERGEGVNRVRVQTDNLDQPLDLNAGGKLELGSTAKLRTLVSYLEIVAALHAEMAADSPRQLAERQVSRRDRLSRWAVEHLTSAPDKSLPAMLQAALQRRYSASPAETFFTGSGAHTFGNFNASDNGKVMSVADAFRDSVNLVFVRLMRDIVHHHIYRTPGEAERILEDPTHPQRAELLARFADEEGSRFLRQFHARHRGQDVSQVLESIAAQVRPTPLRLAVIFRSANPGGSFEDFLGFMARQPVASAVPEASLKPLFERHGPDRFSLADRAYLARVHPLELWLAGYLARHPQAGLQEVIDASRSERQEVYQWLFRSRAKRGQDTRIQSLLEVDAFARIHRSWKRLGFPFDSLVPSYATALGSSGDRPAALAELVGIVLNDGVRLPSIRVEAMRFAADSPYEAVLETRPSTGERVLPPAVAAAVRQAMTRVVAEGTARRVHGALDPADGPPIRVGGKTGTGDNRLESHGRGGALVSSRPVSRTATFVFFMGDRFYGTVTAYVPGRAADAHRFTSALPVQVLKTLAPQLRPLLNPAASAGCAPGRTPMEDAAALVLTSGKRRATPTIP